MQSYEAMNKSTWTRKFRGLGKKHHQISGFGGTQTEVAPARTVAPTRSARRREEEVEARPASPRPVLTAVAAAGFEERRGGDDRAAGRRQPRSGAATTVRWGGDDRGGRAVKARRGGVAGRRPASM